MSCDDDDNTYRLRIYISLSNHINIHYYMVFIKHLMNIIYVLNNLDFHCTTDLFFDFDFHSTIAVTIV